MKEKTLTGGCLCGAVRYEITEMPEHMGFCHCRSCQRMTGAASLPFVLVSEENVTVTGNFVEYTSIGSSGNPVRRAFCPTCGSTLFGRPEILEGRYTISASSLDSPDIFKPGMEVWLEDAQEWSFTYPETHKFDQNPS